MGATSTMPANRAIVPPITLATSFVQPNLGEHGEFCYSRCGNPTRRAYETALRDVEAGTYCTATASGMAAAALALELLEPGAHVIAMEGLYGGTHRLFERVRRRTMGLDFSYVDLNDVGKVCDAINDNTGMIWVETPTNPLLRLVDIRALAERVRAVPRRPGPGQRLLICVDNTFATAWNQRPLELGADLVMLSSSKFIGGHSDMTGGALIAGDDAVAKKLDLLKTSVGAIASPFEAYLALRGLKTLAVRMERLGESAQRVAEFLESHDRVAEVHYPGLRSSPQHSLCRRQMRSGGSVVTVRLRGPGSGGDPISDMDFMRRFFGRLRYWVLAESLGGVESMINHSATMSHGSMSAEERAQVGVFDTTLRLSVGLEDIADLIQDLREALAG